MSMDWKNFKYKLVVLWTKYKRDEYKHGLEKLQIQKREIKEHEVDFTQLCKLHTNFTQKY